MANQVTRLRPLTFWVGRAWRPLRAFTTTDYKKKKSKSPWQCYFRETWTFQINFSFFFFSVLFNLRARIALHETSLELRRDRNRWSCFAEMSIVLLSCVENINRKYNMRSRSRREKGKCSPKVSSLSRRFFSFFFCFSVKYLPSRVDFTPTDYGRVKRFYSRTRWSCTFFQLSPELD